jgi:hypothetical protein
MQLQQQIEFYCGQTAWLTFLPPPPTSYRYTPPLTRMRTAENIIPTLSEDMIIKANRLNLQPSLVTKKPGNQPSFENTFLSGNAEYKPVYV